MPGYHWTYPRPTVLHDYPVDNLLEVGFTYELIDDIIVSAVARHANAYRFIQSLNHFFAKDSNTVMLNQVGVTLVILHQHCLQGAKAVNDLINAAKIQQFFSIDDDEPISFDHSSPTESGLSEGADPLETQMVFASNHDTEFFYQVFDSAQKPTTAPLAPATMQMFIPMQQAMSQRHPTYNNVSNIDDPYSPDLPSLFPGVLPETVVKYSNTYK